MVAVGLQKLQYGGRWAECEAASRSSNVPGRLSFTNQEAVIILLHFFDNAFGCEMVAIRRPHCDVHRF